MKTEITNNNIMRSMLEEITSEDFVIDYVANIYAVVLDSRVEFYYELRDNRPATREARNAFEEKYLSKYYDAEVECVVANTNTVSVEERGELVWSRHRS